MGQVWCLHMCAIRATWLVHTCDMTFCNCDMTPIQMCDTPSYVWLWFICVTFFYTCDMIPIHMCDMPHACDGTCIVTHHILTRLYIYAESGSLQNFVWLESTENAHTLESTAHAHTQMHTHTRDEEGGVEIVRMEGKEGEGGGLRQKSLTHKNAHKQEVAAGLMKALWALGWCETWISCNRTQVRLAVATISFFLSFEKGNDLFQFQQLVVCTHHNQATTNSTDIDGLHSSPDNPWYRSVPVPGCKAVIFTLLLAPRTLMTGTPF